MTRRRSDFERALCSLFVPRGRRRVGVRLRMGAGGRLNLDPGRGGSACSPRILTTTRAILALEDGSVWEGEGFGAPATVTGEVCFNTSMTGYQEILTDPSYHGQIVAMTYPHIGNYGVNAVVVESWKPHVFGFVVREVSPVVSNWRAEEALPDYLERYGIPGIQGVDTRSLTRKLRVRGAMNGVLSTEGLSRDEAIARARAFPGLIGADYA